MYGSYDHSWMFGGGMLLGGLWMIILWGIPLLLAIALLKYLFVKTESKHGQNQPSAPASALDILDNAYARGDISREEYLQKRDDIKGKG
ncbi:SHOCT domain-containing protein [Sulfuriferula thiophila]|uniref:SHOCT domain-containing protein n=1 Tax=Sulfuriferula thiophila TaxID=1781211 RepID=UPI001CB9D06A|nr:SHOCT domain-containing protein [Sulfuriferula thiophila]